MYLVTGGAGFCGIEIVKYLLNKGQKVRVLDIDPLPKEILENPNVEYLNIDIRDKEGVSQACVGIDKIIHTVAKVPISKAGEEFISVNVGGTDNILRAAMENNIPKVVHLSSSSVQFPRRNPVQEDDPLDPVGPYASSKMKAEFVCHKYIKQGLDVDIIRPRTVLGTGRLGIFGILFEWIYEDKNIYVIGNGKNTIQFISSEDLAECCYLSSLKKGSYIFNVGSRQCASLRSDLGYLIKYANSSSKIRSLPASATIWLLRALDLLKLSPLAPWHYLSYHKDFYFDNENPRKVLGWVPKYSNKEILKIAYDSYIKDKNNPAVIYGTSHRKALKQRLLKVLKFLP